MNSFTGSERLISNRLPYLRGIRLLSNDPITKLGKVGAQKRVSFAVLGALRNARAVGFQRGQLAYGQMCACVRPSVTHSVTEEEAMAGGSFYTGSWLYMIHTHDHARVGAPNCKSTTFDTSRQLLKTLNTCWFYMIRTHDHAGVGAPNCKSTISAASRRVLKALNTC